MFSQLFYDHTIRRSNTRSFVMDLITVRGSLFDSHQDRCEDLKDWMVSLKRRWTSECSRRIEMVVAKYAAIR